MDREKALVMHAALQERGVRVNQRCSWFFSAAHDDQAIEETLAAADGAFKAIS